MNNASSIASVHLMNAAALDEKPLQSPV